MKVYRIDKMEETKNISKFFQEYDFIESIIIEFTHLADKKQFILIVDYVNWELERGKREFKKLVFHNVENITRLWSEVDTYKHIGFYYSIKEHGGGFPIQDVEVQPMGVYSFRIKIMSDYNFGGIEFESSLIECKSKIGIGKQVAKEKWNYIDVDTNEEFEYSLPFD